MSTRELFQKVVINQPYCTRTYGTAPCTAVLGVTGTDRCYNTLVTCQDRTNYIATDLPLTFCKQNENMPRDEGTMIPSIVSVSTTPTTLNLANASVDQGPLGRRAAIKIVLSDHPYHDRLVDKYWRLRSFDAAQQSTFWAKWLVRNPYHKGGNLQVIESDLAGVLSERTRNYIIDRIDYSSNGKVTITAKDVLAPLSESFCPRASNGSLELGITDVQTVFNVSPFTGYGTSGYIRIDNEIMSFTRAGTVFTVARGAYGTTAEAHEAGSTVQECVHAAGRVDAIIAQLMFFFGGVSLDYINVAGQWTAEADKWGNTYDVDSLITEPTKVSELIGELLEQCSCSVWWDEVNQVIPFKFVRPVDPSTEVIVPLNGAQHVKVNSVNIRPRPEQRVDEVWFYYGMRNPAAGTDSPENFARIRVTVAAQQQIDYAPDPDNIIPAVKRIFSRWFLSGALGSVVTTSTRILQRLATTPRDISFALDAKDRDVWTGDIVELTVRALVDFTGAQLPTMLQITSAEDAEDGHSIEYIATLFGLAQRSAFITPNDYPVYSLATDAQKLAGCWICQDDGYMPNGDVGYLLT